MCRGDLQPTLQLLLHVTVAATSRVGESSRARSIVALNREVNSLCLTTYVIAMHAFPSPPKIPPLQLRDQARGITLGCVFLLLRVMQYEHRNSIHT